MLLVISIAFTLSCIGISADPNAFSISTEYQLSLTHNSSIQEEWNRTFGGDGQDVAYSVRQTIDGGFIVAGYTNSFNKSDSDAWLIKVDSNGYEEWNRTFGGKNSDGAYSIQQTADGGYIIAGYTCSFGSGKKDIWLIKTDSNGYEEWNRTFGGFNDEGAFSVQQTRDEGYIIAGYTCSFGSGYGDVWLVKTDSNGYEEWNRTFGGKDWDVGHSVQQTSDGGYIIAGYTCSFNIYSVPDAWLIKTDSSGVEKWDKRMGGKNRDQFFFIEKTSDGGYIAVGLTEPYTNSGYDAWLVKLNSMGGIKWSKRFGENGWNFAYSVQQTRDGGYIIAGSIRYHDGKASLIKVDYRGREEWVFKGKNNETAYSVQQTEDGGYVVTGHIGPYNNYDVWLMKIKKPLTPPTVIITRPDRYIYVRDNETIPFIIPIIVGKLTVKAEAYSSEEVEKVEFYLNNILQYTDVEEPYTWTWEKSPFGFYRIEAKVYDKGGKSAFDSVFTIRVI